MVISLASTNQFVLVLNVLTPNVASLPSRHGRARIGSKLLRDMTTGLPVSAICSPPVLSRRTTPFLCYSPHASEQTITLPLNNDVTGCCTRAFIHAKRASPVVLRLRPCHRLQFPSPTTSWGPTPSLQASRGTSRRNSCRRARLETPACCRWSPCAAESGWAGSWRRPTRRTCVGRCRLRKRWERWRSSPEWAPLGLLW